MKPLCLCSGDSVSMQYDLSLDCILHSSGGRKRTLGLPPIPQCPLAEAASVWLCFRSVPLIYECLHEQSERLQCGSISALWMAAGHAGKCQVSLPSRAAVHRGRGAGGHREPHLCSRKHRVSWFGSGRELGKLKNQIVPCSSTGASFIVSQ